MLKTAKFLAKEAVLRAKYIMEKDCLFCKMMAGEVKTKPLMETNKVLVIHDINPVADTHILIIPKKHIDSVLTIESDDSEDLIAMFKVAKKLVEVNSLSAFRLSFNGGKFQHVPHLHMHLIAGSKVEWSKL